MSGCTTLTPEQQVIYNINKEVNSVPYVPDHQNYNVDEFLANPTLFYKNGGDCEDYSIAKYYELRKQGFSSEQLWVVMGVEDGEGHAVLIIELKNTTYVLDNKKRTPYNIRYSRLQPHYKMNENSVYGFRESRFDSEIFEGYFSNQDYLTQIQNAFYDIKQNTK